MVQIFELNYPLKNLAINYAILLGCIFFPFVLISRYWPPTICSLISIPFFYLVARNKLVRIKIHNTGVSIDYKIKKRIEHFDFENIDHFFFQTQSWISDPYFNIVFLSPRQKKRISLPIEELNKLMMFLKEINVKVVKSRYTGEGRGL